MFTNNEINEAVVCSELENAMNDCNENGSSIVIPADYLTLKTLNYDRSKPIEAYRLRAHPSLTKCTYWPLNFFEKVENGYKPTDELLSLSTSDIMLKLCLYKGTFNVNVCNHDQCVAAKQFIAKDKNGVRDFLLECSSTVTLNSVENVLTFFNVEDNVSRSLANKINNGVILTGNSKSKLIHVCLNANLVKGWNSFPLITCVDNKNVYEVKINATNIDWYPFIVSARIVANTLYVNVLNDCVVNVEKPIGVITGVQMCLSNLPECALISFVIPNFKNDVYPSRRFTEQCISLFMGFKKAIFVDLSTQKVSEYISKFCAANNIDENFSKTKLGTLIETNIANKDFDASTMFEDDLKEAAADLLDNQFLHFLVRKTSNLEIMMTNYINEFKMFMNSMNLIKTRDFHFQIRKWDWSLDTQYLRSTDGFFTTKLMVPNDFGVLLFKPNMHQLKAYDFFLKNILPFISVWKIKFFNVLPNDIFSALYKNCGVYVNKSLNKDAVLEPGQRIRAYAPAWHSYLNSGPTLALLVGCESISNLRSLCMRLRQNGALSWTKNEIHCSINAEETVENIKTIFDDVDLRKNIRVLYEEELKSTYVSEDITDMEDVESSVSDQDEHVKALQDQIQQMYSLLSEEAKKEMICKGIYNMRAVNSKKAKSALKRLTKK